MCSRAAQIMRFTGQVVNERAASFAEHVIEDLRVERMVVGAGEWHVRRERGLTLSNACAPRGVRGRG